MHLVDSHCHLNDERLLGDVEAVIQRAQEAEVKTLQTICTCLKDFDTIKQLTEKYPNIYCSFGIHPHHADKDMISQADIVQKAQHPKVIGIGETGLDYFYENAPKKEQRKSFITHIRAARALDLPVIIHTRDADEDTMRIMDDLREEGPYKALFHCFSSSERLAEYGIEKGIYFSASGILTFKKSDLLRKIFKQIPSEQLLVETDAPYLAPEPKRGKVCEPAFTRYTAQLLADIRGQSLEDLAEETTKNFFSLFKKAKKTGAP